MQNNASFIVHQSSRLEENQAAHNARQLIQINQNYNTLLSGAHLPSERNSKLRDLLSELTKLMENDLPQAPALSLAGRIASDLGKKELANNYHTNAINLDPSSAQINLNHAYHLMDSGQYSEALTRFKLVLSIERSNLQAFKGIAASHLKLGQFDLSLIHYQSLLSFGVVDATVQEHLYQCIENLHCDAYVKTTEDLLLYLYSIANLDPARLNRFASEILSHKYGLESPDSAIDLDLLVADQLFLNMLEAGLVHSPSFESLVTSVRKSILIESTLALTLRDQLIKCASAIAVYSNHADYGLSSDEDEEAEISALIHLLTGNIDPKNDVISDNAGALILVAMYEALYYQPFAVSLLKYDLEKWPAAMQGVMQHALYDLAKEHDTHRMLFGESMSELLDNNVSRASQRWKAYPSPVIKSFRQHLTTINGGSSRFDIEGHKTYRVLVLGCGSGQRAYQYASRFYDVDVIGIDNNKRNLCYAFSEVKDLNLTNLEYCHSDYLHAPCSQLELFDYIEVSENFDYAHMERWLPLLAPQGVLKLFMRGIRQQEQLGIVNDLLQARRLQPSLENIRMLRHSILLEEASDLWGALTSNVGFYSSAGCRDILFNRNLAFFDFDRCQSLVSNAGLKIVEPEGRDLQRTLDTDQLVSVVVSKI